MFEWDEDKNAANIAEHGVCFDQASRIFDGPTFTSIDDRYDYGELREISIGSVDGVAVLVVVHTDRSGKTRIISARPATRSERQRYDEELRKAYDARGNRGDEG